MYSSQAGETGQTLPRALARLDSACVNADSIGAKPETLSIAGRAFGWPSHRCKRVRRQGNATGRALEPSLGQPLEQQRARIRRWS